ncbi:Erythritol/L-threitol dehydrogenase [Geodia barretti]|uniref:Erythritol/L-threitol dehydrogenase n=1 Tax=Geodia barretti TaxID=519541 RepID=A0AA35WHE0_GEOBA|nr:Erythritol/L-threitol dehydrogenase [Geodia barretti]
MNGSTAALPDEMKCFICRSKGEYGIGSRPVPDVGEGEVLVRVLAVGICAGDAKCYAGAARYWGDDRTPCYVEPPMIQGHEFVGEVIKLGQGAGEMYGLSIGDNATSENIVPCWNCQQCLQGRYHLCEGERSHPHVVFNSVLNFFRCSPSCVWLASDMSRLALRESAFAEYMKFPKGAINYKVPKSIPAWQAAFIEPLACSVHAVELGSVQFRDTVVIAGCGPLGLGMVAAAKLKNPTCVIALDLYDWKLEVAKKCGADVVLNPSHCDVVEKVRSLTREQGCDAYIEATGHPQSVKQG